MPEKCGTSAPRNCDKTPACLSASLPPAFSASIPSLPFCFGVGRRGSRQEQLPKHSKSPRLFLDGKRSCSRNCAGKGQFAKKTRQAVQDLHPSISWELGCHQLLLLAIALHWLCLYRNLLAKFRHPRALGPVGGHLSSNQTYWRPPPGRPRLQGSFCFKSSRPMVPLCPPSLVRLHLPPRSTTT